MQEGGGERVCVCVCVCVCVHVHSVLIVGITSGRPTLNVSQNIPVRVLNPDKHRVLFSPEST